MFECLTLGYFLVDIYLENNYRIGEVSKADGNMVAVLFLVTAAFRVHFEAHYSTVVLLNGKLKHSEGECSQAGSVCSASYQDRGNSGRGLQSHSLCQHFKFFYLFQRLEDPHKTASLLINNSVVCRERTP